VLNEIPVTVMYHLSSLRSMNLSFILMALLTLLTLIQVPSGFMLLWTGHSFILDIDPNGWMMPVNFTFEDLTTCGINLKNWLIRFKVGEVVIIVLVSLL